jgi:hypothetical protein
MATIVETDLELLDWQQLRVVKNARLRMETAH